MREDKRHKKRGFNVNPDCDLGYEDWLMMSWMELNVAEKSKVLQEEQKVLARSRM